MSGLGDGERTLLVSNGTSIKFLRQSRATNGSLTPLIFKATVVQPTLDALLLTLDGGKFGDTKELILSMRKERSWKFKVEKMLSKETLLLVTKDLKFTNNGTSSMLMNTKKNQRKVSLIRSSVCMLTELSTLFLNSLKTDT
jgi:hypothetical protein